MTRQRDQAGNSPRIDQQQPDALTPHACPTLFVAVVATAEIDPNHMLHIKQVPQHQRGQHRPRRVRLECLVVRQFQHQRMPLLYDPQLHCDRLRPD